MTKAKKAACKIVAYYRVSTQKQGDSGLGLEAQQTAVAALAQQRECVVVAAYTEVETGKRADRPELAKALAHAKRSGATLCIAKLDRLARNTRFLLALVESGADLAFGDLPHIPPGAAGKFIVTQFAAVAELEAGLISERTKAALTAAKARGVVLGGRRANAHTFTDADRQRAGERAGERHRAAAEEAYSDLVPIIQGLRAEGFSLGAIADRLNAQGQTTRTGAAWSRVQIKRILDRTT